MVNGQRVKDTFFRNMDVRIELKSVRTVVQRFPQYGSIKEVPGFEKRRHKPNWFADISAMGLFPIDVLRASTVCFLETRPVIVVADCLQHSSLQSLNLLTVITIEFTAENKNTKCAVSDSVLWFEF